MASRILSVNSTMENAPQRRPNLSRLPLSLEEIPPVSELLQFITEAAERSAGSDPLPEADPLFPPLLPEEFRNTEYTNPKNVGLSKEDLDTSRPPRAGAIKKIMTLIQLNNYRAAGLNTPMTYRIYQNCSKYDNKYPDQSRGHTISLGINHDPITPL